MTIEEMAAKADALQDEIDDLLDIKAEHEEAIADVKAKVAVLRAELGPLARALRKVGDIDKETLRVLKGVPLSEVSA